MDKAWHLRQDGKAFPVKFHLYCMGDDDLLSEAEAASFIILTNSKDQDVAKRILDIWIALLIIEELEYEDFSNTDMDSMISYVVNNLDYPFQYVLPISTLQSIHRELGNYSDLDTMKNFLNKERRNLKGLQDEIKRSLNQQFCRVRYGGQYDSLVGSNEIWFRISSVGYNWSDTIYAFVSSLRRSYRVSNITICRDSESDGGLASKEEYFYKAKDGTLYHHLSIDEYLSEEHESNPVFESINMNEGILCTIHKLLYKGWTYAEVMSKLRESNIYYGRDLWNYLLRKEKSKSCVSNLGG